jgi:hypothetical protein
VGQANELWAIGLKDKTNRKRVAGKYEISKVAFGPLWILASDSETASRKARRWMKQNDYVGFAIISVESHGSIDVF